MRARLLFPLLFLAACDAATLGTMTTTASGCSITLTGAISSSNACSVAAVAAYNSANDETTVTFDLGGGLSVTTHVSAKFGGVPQQTTHVSTDLDASGTITVTNGSGQTWLASANTGTLVGTYSLTLTSVTATSGGGGTIYTVHGTVAATLPAEATTGATGSIALAAIF